jgi:hypothetical protein
MADAVILGPDDSVQERPFTDPRHTREEAEVMRTALGELRLRAAAWADEPRRRIVQRDRDEHGLRHLIVVPDTKNLLGAELLTAVGFFGRARDDVDHSALFDLEDELVAAMDEYADVGLVTYYDVELPKSAYGNLVLFSTPEVPPEWAANTIHRRAVAVSPNHYDYVRLHKGTVCGRLLEGCELTIDRTKYLDFGDPAGWRAVRQFS